MGGKFLLNATALIMAVATLGTALIEGVLQGSRRARPLVVTFRENPAFLTAPETFPGSLLTFEQKLDRMESLGIRPLW